MSVLPSAARTTAGAPAVVAAGGCGARTGCARRRKDRKFLGNSRRTTLRTLGPFPMAGTYQDLTVCLALRAMKFVDRHAPKITSRRTISSLKRGAHDSANWAKSFVTRVCPDHSFKGLRAEETGLQLGSSHVAVVPLRPPEVPRTAQESACLPVKACPQAPTPDPAKAMSAPPRSRQKL
jgi:hypothetical protein